MFASSHEQPWEPVSHNEALRKQVFLSNGQVPHVTQFAQSIFPPGESAPAHHHDDMWESFFVAEGNLTLLSNNERHQFVAGDQVTIAPGESHELRNEGSVPLRLIYFSVLA